jgi:hypothetical protein
MFASIAGIWASGKNGYFARTLIFFPERKLGIPPFTGCIQTLSSGSRGIRSWLSFCHALRVCLRAFERASWDSKIEPVPVSAVAEAAPWPVT